MNAWLRFLLGLDPDEVAASSEASWELTGLPQGTWLLLAITIVAAAVCLIVLLYFREQALRTGPRLVLSGLRLGALAIVILILLNPRLVTEIHFERHGRTLVLVDVSGSMEQQDTFTGDEARDLRRASGLSIQARPTRSELTRAALERNRILERLEERNRVQLYAIAEEARRVDDLEALRSAPLPGLETRLGSSVVDGLRQAGSELIAEVVLISDGRNNAGPHPMEHLASSPSFSRVPVNTVAVGKEEVPRNYAVKDLAAPSIVEHGFPVQIEAQIRLAGIRGPARVTLLREKRGEDPRTVEERFVTPATRVVETSLKFIDVLPEKGRYRYTLEIQRHEDEINQRDNLRRIDVVAADEKHRVLLLAGAPSWEFRYLRNFLLRDVGAEVSCFLTSADPIYPQDGDVVITEIPRNADALKEYDVVFLLDPDPATLTIEFQRGLIDFVSEQGGGLAFVAGESYTAELSSSATCERLRRLLPVTLEPASTGSGSRTIYDQPWRPRLTANGLDHTICKLSNDSEKNVELWRYLPPFYYFYPTRKLKPGAVSLLTDDRGQVVAAVHQAGLGEALYFACDEFWRWRAYQEAIPDRFWAGVVRYLAQGKRRAGRREATVETDRDRYTVGDQVRIFLHVETAGGGAEGALQDQQEVEIVRLGNIGGDTAIPPSGRSAVGDGVRKVQLYPSAGEPGRFGGYFRTEEPGEYAVRYRSKEGASFKVQPVSTELEDPSPNFALLEEIAEQSGGEFLELAEIDDLPELIDEVSVTEIVGRRASEVWDSAPLMLLFCGLLVAEWILRKLWHLN